MAAAKMLELTARPPESFEDKVEMGIGKASESVEDIQSPWIKDQQVLLTDGSSFAYLGLRQGVSESTWWLGPGTYLLLAIAHAGARIGRKTYVVDMAGGDKRTRYVAVSNTLIGLILLGTGVAGAAAAGFGAAWTLAGLAVAGLAGTGVYLSMEEIHA